MEPGGDINRRNLARAFYRRACEDRDVAQILLKEGKYVSTPKVVQTNSSVFLPIPYMGKNNILTMISSRETNLLQKSNRQSLQLIISKAIMDILYGIDSKFFRGLNDRH